MPCTFSSSHSFDNDVKRKHVGLLVVVWYRMHLFRSHSYKKVNFLNSEGRKNNSDCFPIPTFKNDSIATKGHEHRAEMSSPRCMKRQNNQLFL